MTEDIMNLQKGSNIISKGYNIYYQYSSAIHLVVDKTKHHIKHIIIRMYISKPHTIH